MNTVTVSPQSKEDIAFDRGYLRGRESMSRQLAEFSIGACILGFFFVLSIHIFITL